jgi:hypothetical protein
MSILYILCTAYRTTTVLFQKNKLAWPIPLLNIGELYEHVSHTCSRCRPPNQPRKFIAAST